MTIAINALDLFLLDERDKLPVSDKLLADFANSESPKVWIIKDRPDTQAIILDGPAANDLERLQELIADLQTALGPAYLGRPIRVYQRGFRGSWKEMKPGDLIGAQLRLL